MEEQYLLFLIFWLKGAHNKAAQCFEWVLLTFHAHSTRPLIAHNEIPESNFSQTSRSQSLVKPWAVAF